MKLQSVFKLIEVERAMQDAQWGGPEQDKLHGSYDWIAYIVKHLGRAVMFPWNVETYRHQMVIVAALAVAAIQWCDMATINCSNCENPDPLGDCTETNCAMFGELKEATKK
jgi:hypothetical protein